MNDSKINYNISNNWFANLSNLDRTRICDTNPEIVGQVRRFETLTDHETYLLWKKECFFVEDEVFNNK